MCNKDEKMKGLNEILEGEQSMSVDLQRRLKSESICRSHVFKSSSVSEVIKSKVKIIISCSKHIELDYERTKLEKDVMLKKINTCKQKLHNTRVR